MYICGAGKFKCSTHTDRHIRWLDDSLPFGIIELKSASDSMSGFLGGWVGGGAREVKCSQTQTDKLGYYDYKLLTCGDK